MYRVDKYDPYAFATVGAALSRVRARGELGAEIALAPGAYREKLVLDVPGLRLLGPEFGRGADRVRRFRLYAR